MEEKQDFIGENRKKELRNREKIDRARSITYYVLSIIEILISFRLIFKLLGANTSSPVVAFLYGITNIFLFPFSGIFASLNVDGFETRSVFEPAAVIAAIVYAIIARGVVKLFEIIFDSGSAERIS